MKNQHGFTIVELLITLVFLAIATTIILSACLSDGTKKVSLGINGVTEVRCINGYMFVVGDNGNARQVMDEFGHGVTCQ